MEGQLFSSQNSDLNNDLALCIDDDDNQMTFVGHIVYLCPSQNHLHPRSTRAQMMLLEPQINYMASKSHVIVLLRHTSFAKFYSLLIVGKEFNNNITKVVYFSSCFVQFLHQAVLQEC